MKIKKLKPASRCRDGSKGPRAKVGGAKFRINSTSAVIEKHESKGDQLLRFAQRKK